MSKVTKFAAVAGGLALATAATLAPAFAVSPGQLSTGSQVYQVKNLTEGGSYAPTISAKPCEEVKYSVRLHNEAFGGLTNIMVKATLPGSATTSVVSNMTATPAEGSTAGTSGTATVNLSSAETVTYEAGSTVLLDVNGNVIKNLPDGIVGEGVNAGDLNGSTTEFVDFKVKVNCPAPTPTPTPQPTPAPVQPQALPQTGAESGLAGMAGTGAIGYAVMAYRRSKKAVAEKLLRK